ncbi:MAG TPA: phosphoribosyltransferase family protein, partial [Vicinamibacterales bacterium]
MPEKAPRVLIPAATIAARIRELAREIEAGYPDGTTIHLVCVLKGGFIFLADLVRAMTPRVTLDFIAVSSYEQGTTTSGEVRFLKDLDVALD